MMIKSDILHVQTVLSFTSDKYLFQPYSLIPVKPELFSSSALQGSCMVCVKDDMTLISFYLSQIFWMASVFCEMTKVYWLLPAECLIDCPTTGLFEPFKCFFFFLILLTSRPYLSCFPVFSLPPVSKILSVTQFLLYFLLL